MFNPVENNFSFPESEESILEFWKKQKIYDKSLQRREGAPKYVFFEGPPTANGKPHPGHCLTRAIKDVFPRYQTMRGYYCQRKAGWDTHGLPVEVEVCKEMGIHSKEEIEEFGVEPFIQKCQQSVWQYMQEWERLTERLGFWVKLDEAYVTYHQSYIESVWWSLKSLFDRNLLYQGHKIIWWWAQGGTALSSGEVGEGYREVMDPSIYVMFPFVDRPNTSLLVWTTTPWTMPSNQFAAVNESIDYATVYDAELDHYLVFAKDLVDVISEKVKRPLEIKSVESGKDLIGQRYVPPFDFFYKDMSDEVGTLKSGGQQHRQWRITSAEFVTTDSGSGAVHEAPPFGEVDHELLIAEQARFADNSGPRMFCPVGPNGKFTSEVPDFEGMWVKDADKPITRALKESGKLYHQEQYKHNYPFCWRASQDPLIQYPRRSWFIRTTEFKDEMLANNQEINWLPGHIRDGRFGKFLESNVDWALSRERYWGTPLPIWVCETSGKMEAIASYDELLSKPGASGMEVWEKAKAEKPGLPDDLRVHKPYIDAITYDSPFESGSKMKRVPEVIDCWYDSGAMPFAQWGYPHQGNQQFAAQFPADFISEAIDQTRGWFYSQLAISTMLFGAKGVAERTENYPHPFKNCIVLGLMLSEWWEDEKGTVYLAPEEAKKASGKVTQTVGKMSKRLRNYRSPQEIFDMYGADALRWYFFAKQPPWTEIQYSERQIKESIPEFLKRLWNVYSFFVLYANIDGFCLELDKNAGQLDTSVFENCRGYRPASERCELDRWILTELNQTLEQVIQQMDRYENYPACQNLTSFVDSLSNWYVRRSRDRFWASDPQSQSKLDAYWTLLECLVTTTKMIAPFVPFLAETIWQNLIGDVQGATESVHLCDYPKPDEHVDVQLSVRMASLRDIASVGLSARAASKLKVRQPLSSVTVILNDATHVEWLKSNVDILKQELNVQSVQFAENAETYVTYQVVPNFKRLGPRVGKLMPLVKSTLGGADGASLLTELEKTGKVKLELEGQTIELNSEDIEVRLEAREGFAAAKGNSGVVVLDTELTPELVRAGLARDLNRFIQDRRKGLDLNFTDRIVVGMMTDNEEIKTAIEENLDYLKNETLSDEIGLEQVESADPIEIAIGDCTIRLYVKKVG
ncbi:MAG: class I tRNA ligase family protein [Planctomycetota bacterium]